MLDYGRNNWSEGRMAGIMSSLWRPPWHYPCCHHQSPFVSTPLVCAACRQHYSYVFFSISPRSTLSFVYVLRLSFHPSLLRTLFIPCSLHTNNSATTQTPILRLNRKLTAAAAAAAIRMPRCQGHDPSFVFWDIQLQKNMFELEKIVPTATQEKNPFSGGNLVPFECSFRHGQALRE